MKENPGYPLGDGRWDAPGFDQSDDHPVIYLSWQNAVDFCDWLSKKETKPYQLPTEAQWEYACRAGTTTPYYNGSTMADLDKIAWFNANSGGKPHPVGQKQPNAWGLYDMLGNIREFVADLYSEDAPSEAVDPTGPKTGDPSNHVVRGGAFTANAEKAGNMRAGSRRPTESLKSTGFRILVEIGADR